VLPGEIVDATAEPLVILAPSPNRVTPRCVHFGECGGCQYQHADYPTQIELKRQILREILALNRIPDPPEIQLHHAAEWEYRNRIRLRIHTAPDSSSGAIQIGYSRRASNDFLPIGMCPIAAPLLLRAASALAQLAAADPAMHRWLRSVAEAELFCSADETRLQILFFLNDADTARREPAAFAQLCDRLRALVPQLAGAGAQLLPGLNRGSRGKARRNARWDGAAWASDGLAYSAGERIYWVSRGAFFQVNRFLVDRLVALVTASQSGDLAWDLFAGVGLFTRALADSFTHVVAVEAGDVAAADLAAAARGGKGRPAFEAVHSPALDFLRARELQRERPNLIVLDPPRAGLGPDAAEVLARIAAPRLVYVSCDPVTLARDLAIVTHAYRIVSIDLIDLFPQTFHMETVVHLHKWPGGEIV